MGRKFCLAVSNLNSKIIMSFLVSSRSVLLGVHGDMQWVKSLFEEEKPRSGSKTQNILAHMKQSSKEQGCGSSFTFSWPRDSPSFLLCLIFTSLCLLIHFLRSVVHIQLEPLPQRTESINLNLDNGRIFFTNAIRKIPGKIVITSSCVLSQSLQLRYGIICLRIPLDNVVHIQLYGQEAKISCLKPSTGNYMI